MYTEFSTGSNVSTAQVQSLPGCLTVLYGFFSHFNTLTFIGMVHYYFSLSRLTSLMYLQIDQLGLKLSLYFTPGSKISKGVEALFGKVDTFTTPLDKAMVQNISKGENINFSMSWSCTKPSMLSQSIKS